MKIISCLNTKKVTEMDQVHAKFLEKAVGALAYSMSKIINLPVRLSVFSKKCKISMLKPLFRKS